MSIVIQQAETRRFLAEDDEWVTDPHDGVTFSDTRHAINYCRRHALEQVRLVVVFNNKKVSLLFYIPGSKVPSPACAIKAVA